MRCSTYSVFCAFLALCSLQTKADEVQVYNWESFLSDDVIQSFQEETGHTVKQLYFDDESDRDHVITSGRGGSFDLVMIESTSLDILSEQGLFHDLSVIRAPLEESLDSQWVEACGKNGIPYAWGTTGLIYRSSVAVEPLSSWGQLFTPPVEHQGRVVMYFDQIDAPGTALLAVGSDPFTDDPEELKKAYRLLKEQSPHLLAREFGLSYALNNGQNHQMSLTLGYAGEDSALREELDQDDWVYVVPDEGSLLWVECLAIPSNRTVNQATKDFIAYMNRADIAAINAEETWFSTPNHMAKALTSEDYQQDKGLFPPPEVLQKSHLYQRLEPQALRLRHRMLQAVSSQQ